MTLLVRDEADIVRQNIEFHLARGVDHIIATDNASTDGTTQILDEYQRAGCLSLIREPSNDYQQVAWVNRMIDVAKDKFGAAWIINNDADEFWRPRDTSAGISGNLRELLAHSPSVCVLCKRMNMITSFDKLGSEPWSEGLVWRSVVKARPNKVEMQRRAPMRYPFFCYNLPKKVIVHTEGLVSIEKGNHSARFDHDVDSIDLGVEIFHFPIRSKSEFVSSILQISEAIKRDATWRKNESEKYLRWADILSRTGEVEAVVADALPSRFQLLRYRLTGRLVRDDRLRNDLRAIGKE